MNKILGLLLLAGIAGNGYLAWELKSRIPPTNADLDADIAGVRAQREALKQTGSTTTARLDQIYAETEAMLAQQRQALVRFITLTHTIDTKAVPKASAIELAEIEKTIAQEKAKAEIARTDAAKYAGGLIQALIQVRLETIDLSIAGLEQRWLAGKYGVPLPVVQRPRAPDIEERLTAIEQEIRGKRVAIANAEAEAARYTGGLIQVLALSRAETDKLTLAMLEQRALALRYDIGLPTLDLDADKPSKPPKPPGKVVGDKEAIQ